MTTSPKQMACRMHNGHLWVLQKRLASPGCTLVDASTPGWAVQGLQVVLKTLARWGALVNGEVTAIGVEAIRAYKEKYPKA
jgi:hypothetical protein